MEFHIKEELAGTNKLRKELAGTNKGHRKKWK
jgi:hypothetical protein